jgi:putative nucleotidyltransferase-like protein
MSSGSDEQLEAFPPVAKIAAALGDVTEVLARELTLPTDEPPMWSDFEWRIARAVAAMQGVSSLLATSLRWRGPPNWRRFLDDQRNHTMARHLRIVRLLDSIDTKSRRAGIPLVALKGVALHKSGVYEVGERPMADIDLLIHEANLQPMAALLDDCDYDLTFTTWRHKLYESRLGTGWISDGLGEHTDNPIKIELHTSIRERLPVSETDITQFLFPLDAPAGLNTYPSLAALMLHLLLHATGNMRAHALRLIQLHDIARLASRFKPDDWEELLNARPSDRGLWWAVPPLTMAAHYYPAAIPPTVLARLERECSWLLAKLSRRQSLTDVSWSNIKVHAFPGIQWSRTPQEAVRFMLSRMLPSRDARIEIQRFAANQPRASDIPWYGISQRERIVRWLFSRPPRVQTLLSVRAALAQRHDESDRGISADG